MGTGQEMYHCLTFVKGLHIVNLGTSSGWWWVDFIIALRSCFGRVKQSSDTRFVVRRRICYEKRVRGDETKTTRSNLFFFV